MKRIIIYKATILLCLSCLVTERIRGQVTIGSGNTPAIGMVLEIKEIEPDVDSFTKPLDLKNKTVVSGGLGLPRVRLVSKNTLEPFLLSPDADEKALHTGLMVYNVNEDNFCLGLHIWEGTKWEYLKEVDAAPQKIVDSRDNEVYVYKTFDKAGDWFIQNLRYSGGGEGKNPNLGAAILDYGKLYTWAESTSNKVNVADEANDATIAKVGGLCPLGWHIPSDYDWNILESILSNEQYNRFVKGDYISQAWESAWETSEGLRGTHGKSMKSTEQIDSDIPNGISKSIECGGFNALLVGNIDESNTPSDFGSSTTFWSSSSAGAGVAWARTLNSTSAGVKRETLNRGKYFSIRCKKN